MSLTFPHYLSNPSPSNQCPPTYPIPRFAPSPPTTTRTEDSPHTPRFSGIRLPYYALPPPFPKQPSLLFKPTPVLPPPTPSPLLNHRTIQTAKTHLPRPSCVILPLPLFWPTPVPPTFCYASLCCLPSLTSCTLPPLHPCLSPYQMVPFSPPNLAPTSIFRAYLSRPFLDRP